jgi:hypothetical protein
MDTKNPLSFVTLWPLFGWTTGETHWSWSALWPFFRYTRDGDLVTKWDGPWPFVHYYRNDRPGKRIDQWWLWPLISVTKTLDWDSTVLLWPLIWLREFRDVDSVQNDHYFLPLWWDSTTRWEDGRATGYWRAFPLIDHRWTSEGNRETRVLDPVPFEHRAHDGYEENYGFLWTLYKSQHTAASDRIDLTAHLFTHRSDERGSKSSMPFLWSRETNADGSGVFRLFQCIPIRFGADRSRQPETKPAAADGPGGAK